MICTTDSKGRTVFVGLDREELKRHTVDFKETLETYRIRPRTVSADGGAFLVYVMTIYPPLRRYEMRTVDGDVMEVGLNEFLQDNPEMAPEVKALKVGQTYMGGGGAAPEWSITRIPDAK